MGASIAGRNIRADSLMTLIAIMTIA